MIVRVRKSNAAENALRTLFVGLSVALVILLVTDPAVRFYDKYIRPTPWLVASIEVVPREDDFPFVRYGVFTSLHVYGTWKAYIVTENGRGCWGSGAGNYSKQSHSTTNWEWFAFFENSCLEPDEPYQICVTYSVTSQSGVHNYFGPFCSELYDPTTGEHDED